MDVFDAGRNLRELMAAGVEHRDSVAASQQSVDDEMAGRPGSSDNKRLHNLTSLARRCASQSR